MHRHDEIAVITRLGKFDNHACDYLARNHDMEQTIFRPNRVPMYPHFA
jgi:hypothetical protein